MGAALEIFAIPTLLLLAILILGVIADFSVGTVVAAAAMGFLLVFAAILLMRKERELEGPEDDREQDPDREDQP